MTGKTHHKGGSLVWELILLVLMASIIFLMIFFNDVITYLGFKDLQANLLNLNRENSRQDFLGMVAKYKLHKNLYENKIDDSGFTIEEIKINSLIGSREKSFTDKPEKYKEFLPLALFFVNSVRYAMGREPLYLNMKDPARCYLDVAYYYERNKLFKKALDIYQRTMGVISQGDESVPIIQLHQGFCSSIIGYYEKAREEYTTVITSDRNREVTKTAKILVSYLDEIHQEIMNVMASEADPIEKGEKLYKLMAYDEAIKTLDSAEPATREDLEKRQYYKARSMEENGETKNSVEIYQDIITQNPESDYALMSNRRILTLSVLNDNNKELKKVADKNNKVIGDSKYDIYSMSLSAAAGESNTRSLEDILEENQLSTGITEDILSENSLQEQENKAFIDGIVSDVVKDDNNTSTNITSYDQAVEKLEQAIQNQEKKNTGPEEEDKKLAEIRSAHLKELNALNAVLEQEKKRTDDLQKKLEELEEENTTLEKDKELIEKQLEELKEQEELRTALEEEKLLVENQLNELESSSANAHEDSAGTDELEVVDNTDQFGKIISKYRYGHDKDGNKYIESYSIYYYGDSDELYKVVDYDRDNKMIAYYLIIYDEEDEQIKIKKYDDKNNLMYVD